jgi:hypothetical protein
MMHKIIVTLTCANGPLDEVLFEGEKILEVEVNDPHNTNELLDKIESEIINIRGDATTRIGLEAKTEAGNTVLRGSIEKGFHGVSMP